MSLSLKELQKHAEDILPHRHGKKSSSKDTMIAGTGGKTNYRILPNLRFAHAMPIALLVAGVGVYMVFFGSAATGPCSVTLNPGANIVSALNSAANGSVICLNDGNYNGFRADAASTDKTSYVTLRSVNDKKAVFTSTLTFDNARYIRLEGLKLNGGLNFVPKGDNIEIINNESLYTLYFFGDYRTSTSGCPCTLTNVTVKDNYIHDVHYEDPNDTKGQFGENGITGLHASNFTVSGNTIKSVSGDYIQSSGIDNWTVDSNNFQGPSLRDTNPLEHQDLWQIFGCDFGCYGENGTAPNYHDNITFKNNVARQTGADTGLLFQTAFFRNPRIENNLFDAADRGGGYSAQIYNSEKLIFRNNTIINSPSGVVFRKGYDQTGTKAGTAGSGYQVDHNIFGIEGTLTGYNNPISTESDVSSWGAFDYNVAYNEKTPSYGFVNKGSTSLWTPSWVDTSCYQPKNLVLNDSSTPGYKTTSLCGTPPAISSLKGDLNNDNSVNTTDLIILLSKFGTADPNANLNGQGNVDTTDLVILLSMFGTTGGGTTPPPTANPIPLGVPGNWNYKFGDDFDGTSLDLNKWQPNWLGPSNTAITKPVNDTELSCYDPRQVSVGGGVLSLNLTQKSCTANNGITYGYSSGLINSYSHYQFTYGYVEARMWLDGTGGAPTNWPAFWANGTGNWPATGEIDVMEGLGSGVKPICWHFHYSGGAPGGCVDLQSSNTGWHVFGADWQPGSITFYYDGVEVGKTTTGVTSSPMYLIANHGISSQYGGPVKAPAKIEVDYIRAWQR